MSVGKRLSSRRKELNFTQEDLAYKVNVSRQSISKWELDEYLPDMHNMIELSKVLDVSIEYLVNGTVNNTKIKKFNYREFIVIFIGVAILLFTLILTIINPDEMFAGGSTLYMNSLNILLTFSAVILLAGILLIYINRRK